MDAAEFERYLREQSDRVDGALEAFFRRPPEIPDLTDAARYALGLDIPDRTKRGKRIRPVMCLLACTSLGGVPARAMPFAIASEILHNFLLVHDDIEDRDTVRRDRDAVWVRYGLAHGVNVGDYLFAKTYESVLDCARAGADDATMVRLLQLVTETIVHTGEGQALDLAARERRDLTVDDYRHIVVEKTGWYLAAPAVGGAILAGADDATVSALRTFGRYIGPVFQIADDAIDLTEGKGRGERGSDIKEGKRSLLVVFTASKCSADERGRMFAILDKSREETTADDVAWVISLFDRYGAVRAAREEGDRILDRAKEALSSTPPRLRDAMWAAADFMLARTR